jgi:hypothetical protein
VIGVYVPVLEDAEVRGRTLARPGTVLARTARTALVRCADAALCLEFDEP